MNKKILAIFISMRMQIAILNYGNFVVSRPCGQEFDKYNLKNLNNFQFYQNARIRNYTKPDFFIQVAQTA